MLRRPAARPAGGVPSSRSRSRSGDQRSPWIIPLAVKDAFDIIQETLNREFLLRVSYLEIYNEIKWGGLLIRLFKSMERLSFDVQWRPLYKTLIQTHFKKNMGPEGWKVRQQHFETITSLVRASRTFFPEAFSRISELPMVLPEDPAIKKLGTATWTSHLYMMDAVQVSTVMESAEISHCVAWMESPADLELCVLELSLHLLLRFLDCR
ncbi:hypothetical protein ZWY2020_010635 [Hordeum vulgare]|nr:hypothetical protein ZWY2020_010635 [Hordeum vulgare]